MPLAGLQGADTHDMPRDLLTAFIRDGHHHTVLALFVANRVLDRPFDPHRRQASTLLFGSGPGAEAQMVLALCRTVALQ
jgi:hypothetical protein